MMRRVLGVREADVARMADVLGRHDPSWGSEVFDLAGGRAVLWGAGLYVNRAFGAGCDGPMLPEDFDLLEARSARLGVDASIEIAPPTVPDVRAAAIDRGYVPAGWVTVLSHDLVDIRPPPPATSLVVGPAGDELARWQETSARGWGHTTAADRRASDAFAAATAELDGDGFVLARDVDDPRPVGCASVTVTDGIATLAAMSTVPAARRRGVHRALIEHRLRFARDAGCALAVTTAIVGGASERNLVGNGFSRWFEIEALSLPSR